MNKLLEILFVILILIGTSIDFIVRQFIPNEVLVINSICLFILFFVAYLFHQITTSKSFSTTHSKTPENKDRQVIFQLTPIKTLVNSNDPFLIIRFFAAALVFVTHIMILLHPSQDLLTGYWRVLTGGAHDGMAIFFTLSGFLMGKAFISGRYKLTRDGVLTFYQSRWVRIFPLMFFVSIFMFVLQYPQVLRFDPLSIFRLITFNYYGNTIGLNGIGAMWSLSVEFQYYLIAPFVFSIFHAGIEKNKMRGMIILVATIIAFVLMKYLAKKYLFNVPNLHDPAFFSLIGNFPFFLTGYFFNYIPLRISERAAKHITNGWVLLIVMSLFYLVCNNHSHSVIHFVIISILTGFAISTLDGVRKTDAYLRLRKFSVFKAIQILGVLSYGFYLWHSGIGFIHSKLFPSGFSTHSSYLIEVSIVGVIVLFISFITFVLVEDRFNAYKPINKH